jgi:predicted hotdog family 3-hydroxylacyl-ACP dehydratase
VLRRADRRAPQGYVAVLRDVALHVARLEECGTLHAIARLVREESGGVVYDVELREAGGPLLLEGRAVIAWPHR